jgi:hypothetical protein
MQPGFIRFAVVRNPVGRFTSAYKYHCHMSDVNTDKVFLRSLILNEKLGENINNFVQGVIDSGFDLQNDMWFRRQVYWLRASKPQVILRLENLEADLNIVKSYAPRHFKGLMPKNVSKGREKSDLANIKLNTKSLDFIHKFYERDFFYLAYDK